MLHVHMRRVIVYGQVYINGGSGTPALWLPKKPFQEENSLVTFATCKKWITDMIVPSAENGAFLVVGGTALLQVLQKTPSTHSSNKSNRANAYTAMIERLTNCNGMVWLWYFTMIQLLLQLSCDEILMFDWQTVWTQENCQAVSLPTNGQGTTEMLYQTTSYIPSQTLPTHKHTHTHTHTGVESVFDIVDMEDENRNALLQLTDAQIQVSKIVIRPLGQTKLWVIKQVRYMYFIYLKTSWAFDILVHSRALLAAILCWLTTL